MRQRLNGLAFWITGALMASTLVSAPVACKTQNSAGRTLASVVQTVDAAMQGWASYVALTHPPAEQEAAVRSAYQKYQSAEASAEAAYLAYVKTGTDSGWTAAANALQAAQSGLLGLIAQFNPQKR